MRDGFQKWVAMQQARENVSENSEKEQIEKCSDNCRRGDPGHCGDVDTGNDSFRSDSARHKIALCEMNPLETLGSVG
jgi:hypothetical protein